MRRTLCMAVLLALGGCATTSPPELKNPTAHVRPVERGAATVLPAIAERVSPVKPGPACESERRHALIGGEAPRAAFAECLLEHGEARRAASVVANYLPDREDLRLRADIQTTEGTADVDEATLNALVAETPDDPWAWTALGREYERQGRDAEAADAFLMARTVEAGRREQG